MIRVSDAVQRHVPKMVVLISLLFGVSVLMSDNSFAADINNTPATSTVNSEPARPLKTGDIKAVARFAKTGAFDNDTVVRIARQLAKKPYIA
ncbi:MAG: glucan biosynthesis protein D, partial [Vibrio sp.]